MKTALVTGGLRGIGLGVSKALLADGYSLAICGSRRAEDVTETLAGLQPLTGHGQLVRYYTCNIGDNNDRQTLVQSVQKDFPHVNVLVNNAGVAPKERGDLLHLREENYDWLMKINLQGPLFLTQQIARWMIDIRKNDADYRGVIVNISSVSATFASVNRGEYCISKAGVSMATKLWSLRLAEYGIAVYEIRPGIIQTDMTAGVAEKYDKLIAEGLIPENRWGYPEDVGRCVAMLARGELSYSTGQVINIDGGMTIPRL